MKILKAPERELFCLVYAKCLFKSFVGWHVCESYFSHAGNFNFLLVKFPLAFRITEFLSMPQTVNKQMIIDQ